VNPIEKRVLDAAVAELRIEKGDPGQLPKILGYAAVYDSLSLDLGGFRERIQAGAFSLALGKDPDVRALVDHDPSRILGRTRSGTLSLLNTQKGLRYEIKPADTTAGRDIVESIRRGDVSGSSFGFRTLADKWSVEVIEEQRTLVRTLIDVELFDVSPVTYPAYPDTEVGVRSLEVWKKQNTVVAVDLDMLRRRLRLAEIS
jgi:HK97 family phage prohead protease